MTDIVHGIPDIKLSRSTGAFRTGREAASALADAGPGNHTVTTFGAEETQALNGYLQGARYVARKTDGMSVARRKSDNGGLNVYIVYNQPNS